MRVGRYEVEDEIARGAAGVVYRAHDPELQRDVAVKVLLGAEAASPQARRRFSREARALARLNHPNVLRLHAAEVSEPTPYLVLDLVEGETLADRLERDGPLPLEEAAEIAKKLAVGLTHCHAQGVLHRDLKPANVLMTQAGVPLLADFGLVKDLQRAGETVALTETGTVMGTPGYWSPEQASGQASRVDERTDVYSLGATLYALLTGQPPFLGATLMELAIATQDRPPSSVTVFRPEAPPDLDAIVHNCLAKAPSDRYASADALAADLERFLSGSRISGVGPAARPRVRASGIAAVVVALAIALTIGLWPTDSAPAVTPPASLSPTPRSTVTKRPAGQPSWGWRLPLGSTVSLTAETKIGRVEPHSLVFELELQAGEQLSGGRQRLAGKLQRISGVASGGDTLLPFDTNRPLGKHSTAVQLVLGEFFAEVGKTVSLVLGPQFPDFKVSGLNRSLQLQRGYRFDVNETLRRILGEPLGVLPAGPIAETWSSETPIEIDSSDKVVFAGPGALKGRREGEAVTVSIEGVGLKATSAATKEGLVSLKRYRRRGRLELTRGWVRTAESSEEMEFVVPGGRRMVRHTRCRIRFRVLKRG